MTSDDEIQPILDNEASQDSNHEVPETPNGAPTADLNNDAADEDVEVEIHLTGCGASPFCDPRRMPHRY